MKDQMRLNKTQEDKRWDIKRPDEMRYDERKETRQNKNTRRDDMRWELKRPD